MGNVAAGRDDQWLFALRLVPVRGLGWFPSGSSKVTEVMILSHLPMCGSAGRNGTSSKYLT
jgi:hypothetical protein